MKKTIMVFLTISASVLILAACNVPNGTPTLVAEAQSTQPGVPVATAAPETSQPDQPQPTAVPTQQFSFSPAFYQEESAGIQLAYPSDWTISPHERIGERGAQAALLSPGSSLEQVAAGGARIILTTYTWDPKNDLDAYIAQRKTAWEASGFKVSGEDQFTLVDTRLVKIFTVETTGDEKALFAFTNAGDDYLQLFGDGDLALCEGIIRSAAVVE